jgi:hypothetical protein
MQAKAARAECAWRLGRQRDAVALWRELVLEHGDAVQGAWAAICLLGKAALQHGMAPLGAAAPQLELTLPTTTLCPRPADDARELAGQGVLTLLDMQDPGGSWRDTPYAWISSEHRPNTIMAITGIAARALLSWRDVAPERVDAALARAEAYMTDHGNLGVSAIEKCYAYAYCLRYWVDRAASREGELRQAALDEAARLAAKLRAIQHDEAGWGHEYYNPFATAVGLESMALAARAGVVVPSGSIELARSALEAVRHPAGGFPYGMRGSPTTLLASTGRSPVCERALSLAGAPGEERILAALENFFENFDQLARSRAYDFHSDKFANGGFFYWHDLLPVAEAIAGLESSAARTSFRERMLPLITATAEADGAWVDSQNIGRSYGTAMAMLAIASLLAGG